MPATPPHPHIYTTTSTTTKTPTEEIALHYTDKIHIFQPGSYPQKKPIFKKSNQHNTKLLQEENRQGEL